MTDPWSLTRIVEVFKALVPLDEAYKDFAQKPLRETSEILVDLVKTFRLRLISLRCSAELFDKLAGHIKRARDQVPEDRLVGAPGEISGPLLGRLTYAPDSSLLARMFENLLARAMDRERVAEAHPAFVNIIEQLSRDEALILKEHRERSFEFEQRRPLIDWNRQQPKGPWKIHSNEFSTSELWYPDHFSMYVSHLESLGLMVTRGLHDMKVSESLYTLHVESVYVSGMGSADRHYQKRRGSTKLLPFGELFVNACVPESLEEERDE
ncbi:MAG: DUF4393 domain-containing protein [Planctomycetota bacterium]|nr:DUF4393 domain-containing protein [Planctomycetota bacterium]